MPLLFSVDQTLINHSGVYQIRNLIDNKLYIGSTKNFKIRYNRHLLTIKSRNTIKGNRHLSAAVAKHGSDSFVFEIIKLAPATKQELLDAEQEEINPYIILRKGKQIIDHSRCYNIRTKAASNLGLKVSVKTKKLMSLAAMGEKNSQYGNRGINSISSNKVYQYSITGEFIKLFYGCEEAAKELGVARRNITKCCNFERNTAGGFIFVYEKDVKKVPEIIEQFILSKKKNNKSKQVTQKNLDNSVAATYKSSCNAAKITGFSQQSISYACKTKKKYSGYFWSH